KYFLVPFSCELRYAPQHRRTHRTIFYHRHLYHEIVLFCQLFVVVGYLLNCFPPSFLKPEKALHSRYIHPDPYHIYEMQT
ncbi:unnamed protein product, partial [Brugia timori]|uniref:Ovule protein n=1 Tax=Brugia timori TaxID=42155 RepID=A0A0R3QQL3_9BILA